ncbi:MAG: glycosyltransferase family 2 protein [Cyanobacterium sp. T60_A2020_053]|nr:glycosyltransferase family 2 protein [Cyanobacterium sp. T60_A2020_053]
MPDNKNLETDPITSLIAEFNDPEREEDEFRNDFFQGLSGRRKKSALALTLIWAFTIGLHLLPYNFIVIIALGLFVTIQGFRLMFTSALHPSLTPATDALTLTPSPLAEGGMPFVSLLVSAKNEEVVIAKLVKMLLKLDYPQDRYELWIVDDNSSDKTGEILNQLALESPQLNVLHRDAQGKGGKSGALNQAFSLCQGDIIGVFDADAIVPENILQEVIQLFKNEVTGAVQVRKSISNSSENFWTQGQYVEMGLDSYFQRQRINCGGIGELRGNGQFVLRRALNSCGGWNEETITDDLDLTIRLHLDGWNIDILENPAVGEEGVRGVRALWHQRSRWAEGGYQRYLDYWRFLISSRLNWRKKFDLFFFFMVQYIFPTAALPDFLMVITRHRLPLIAPISSLTLILAFWGMFTGLRRNHQSEISFTDTVKMIGQSFFGMIYMIHWFIVMPVTTARMSFRQKRLKWVKTVHQGDTEENPALGIG